MNIYLRTLDNKKENLVFCRISKYLDTKGYKVKWLSASLIKNGARTVYEGEEWFQEWCEVTRGIDVAIIECTYPSDMYVGFEIGQIVSSKTPVILLYEADKDPVFINEQYNSKIVKSGYEIGNIEEVLSWCLQETKTMLNPRFTFYLSLRLDRYLSRKSNLKGISKSEYIRELIEKDSKP